MFAKQLLGAAAVLALSTGIAGAAPAAIERNATVRTGPGPGYRVIARLPRGTVVDVDGCRRSWCLIAWQDGEGYVARSLLAFGAAPPAVAVGPDVYYDDYPAFGYSYGTGGYVPRHHGRHHNRPGGGWGHAPGGPGWGGRPSVGSNPAPVPGSKSFGQSGPSGGLPSGGGISGGGKGGPSSFGGGGSGGAASAPAASAPAASAPAASPGGSSGASGAGAK